MTSCPKQSFDNSQHVHCALLPSSAPSPRQISSQSSSTVTLDLVTKDHHMSAMRKKLLSMAPTARKEGDAHQGEGEEKEKGTASTMGHRTQEKLRKLYVLERWCSRAMVFMLELDGFRGVLQPKACGKRWWQRSRRRYLTVTSFPGKKGTGGQKLAKAQLFVNKHTINVNCDASAYYASFYHNYQIHLPSNQEPCSALKAFPECSAERHFT